MEQRFQALILIAFGLLCTILMSLGLIDEILRTDIPETQKAFSAWISLVIISVVPLVAGLHFLIPIHQRS